MSHPQLPLSLGLNDHTLFDNFVPGDNAEALGCLRTLSTVQTPCVYLWGASGSGKSHLLQAVCHAAGARADAAFYLPLRDADAFPLEALHGLESMAAVCIDDVGSVAADQRWEQALFQLFERIQHSGCALVATGARPAAELGLDAALASRLSWGLSFQLKALNDADKRGALQQRARRRGLRLADDAARLLVRHYGDDMGELFARFERLDQASMAAKRRLTVGFIRAEFGLGV